MVSFDLTKVFEEPPVMNAILPGHRPFWYAYKLFINFALLRVLLLHIQNKLIVLMAAQPPESSPSIRKAWRQLRSPTHGGIWHAYVLFFATELIRYGVEPIALWFAGLWFGDIGSYAAKIATSYLVAHFHTALTRSIVSGKNGELKGLSLVQQLSIVPFDVRNNSVAACWVEQYLRNFLDTMPKMTGWTGELPQWSVNNALIAVVRIISIRLETENMAKPELKTKNEEEEPQPKVLDDKGAKSKEEGSQVQVQEKERGLMDLIEGVKVSLVLRIVAVQLLFQFVLSGADLLGTAGEILLVTVLEMLL